MNKKKKIGIIVGLVVLLALAGAYAYGYSYFRDHFFFHTTINNIDVSLKTVEEANEALAQTTPTFSIIQKKGPSVKEEVEEVASEEATTEEETTKEITSEETPAETETTTEETPTEEVQEEVDENTITETIDLVKDLEANVQYDSRDLLKNQDPLLWFTSLIQSNDYTCTKLRGTYKQANLEDVIQGLYCMQEENIVEPKNAFLSIEDGKVIINPEEDGCEMDLEVAKQEMAKVLDRYVNGLGDGVIDLTPFYKTAEVKADNEELVQKQDKWTKIIEKSITIKINGDKSVTVAGEELRNLMQVKGTTLTSNDDNIKEYVSSLAYNNNISENEYIDQSALISSIKDVLYNLENATVEAKWIKIQPQPQTPSVSSGTYVDVNLSTQTLVYYQNGTAVLSSPIVSGYGYYATPTGTYHVVNKRTNQILRGPDYALHVDYWIGFDWEPSGNLYGIHDAYWRNGNFGGDIYLSDSSHGCVNMPTGNMASLYSMIAIGTTISIHW